MYKESDIGRFRQTHSFCCKTNPINKLNTKCTKDDIETNEQVRECRDPKVNSIGTIRVITANCNSVSGASIVDLGIKVVSVIFGLLLTEALKSTTGLSSIVCNNEIVITIGKSFKGITISCLNTWAILNREYVTHLLRVVRD